MSPPLQQGEAVVRGGDQAGGKAIRGQAYRGWKKEGGGGAGPEFVWGVEEKVVWGGAMVEEGLGTPGYCGADGVGEGGWGQAVAVTGRFRVRAIPCCLILDSNMKSSPSPHIK